MSRPKLPKLTPGWRLTTAAWRDFRFGWKRYLIIVGIVAVPGNLLALNAGLAQSQLFTATTSFAAFIMNVALLWAIGRRDATGRLPTVAESYYDGQVGLVRYILTAAVLVLMLLFFTVGLILYAAGQVSPGVTSSAFSPDLLLLAFVWLILSIPSFFLLTRFSVAPLAAVVDNLRPIAALRLSWRLTRRRFWAVAGRLVVLGLVIVVLSIPITLVAVLLSIAHAGGFATVFFEIATTMLALTISDLYIMRLYRNLEDTATIATTAG
jgi:hypothetical protein